MLHEERRNSRKSFLRRRRLEDYRVTLTHDETETMFTLDGFDAVFYFWTKDE